MPPRPDTKETDLLEDGEETGLLEDRKKGDKKKTDLFGLVFERLSRRGVRYCLLRMPARDPASPRPADDRPPPELDLLAVADDLPALSAEVDGIGFRPLPSRGHAPHHFFVSRAAGGRGWLKLDVVTELRYGRPVRCLRLEDSAESVLSRCRHHDGVPVRAAHDEFVQLLLHSLLDKGYVAERHRGRLAELTERFRADAELAAAAAEQVDRELSPALTYEQAVGAVRRGRWNELRDRRAALALRLLRNAPLRSMADFGVALLLRRLQPLLRTLDTGSPAS